jgi:hypothetical protein
MECQLGELFADVLYIMSAQARSISQMITQIEVEFDREGLDILAPRMRFGNFARPRRFEIAAALNRLRSLKVKQIGEMRSN